MDAFNNYNYRGYGVAPAVAFAVSRGDAPTRTWYAGRHRPATAATGPRFKAASADTPAENLACSEDTVFDLASLTKPLTTTLWCLRLVEDGRLSLTEPLSRYLPLHDSQLAEQPVWRLLTHTSGLAAHRPYFAGLGPHALRNGGFAHARSATRRMLLRATPEAPPGSRETYSDLGFLLLELLCEGLSGPLDDIWPGLPGHGADRLHFRPTSATPRTDPECAATERCPWRKRLLQGEVHDDNCWTIGGIGGHAGLFGTLAAAHDAARSWSRLAVGREAGLGVSSGLVAEVLNRRWMHPRGTHVVGWDTPTPGASSSGSRFTRRAFGHLGFTGTSVWIDPDGEVVMTLLTNRVSPTRENTGIRAFRPVLHDAAWTWLRADGEHFT